MKKKSIDLIAFDDSQKLQYQGRCKIIINCISSILLVEPKNEEYKMISAIFDKHVFVMDKNILFVFAENEFCDFVLVFDCEIRCQNVYGFICKQNVQNSVTKDMILHRRLLVSLFEKILQKSEGVSKLKKIVKNWINLHEGKERIDYKKLLKANNVYDLIYPSVNQKEGISKDSYATLRNNENNITDIMDVKGKFDRRKRRHAEIDRRNLFAHNDVTTDDNSTTKKSSLKFTKTIDSSLFKLVNYKSQSRIRRRLLIFTKIEQKQCYEYIWGHKKKLYYCAGCEVKGKMIFAITVMEGVKLESTKHVCTPILYTPKKYIEMKIFKKPDYEILENCNIASGKLLIVFDEIDKGWCWEFRREGERFRCSQCNTASIIWNYNDIQNEYVELLNADHNCKTIPYDIKNYYNFNDFLLLPDFEILTKNDVKRLIIFDKNDRSLCYVYALRKKRFHCIRCQMKGLYVSAKLYQNSDGEDYVILSNVKHICEMRSFTELTKKETNLRPPNFELQTLIDPKKIFIFDLNDRSLCYTYTQKYKGKNGYICLGCQSIRTSANGYNRKISYAKLNKDDENDEYFLQLNDVKHFCKPKKYEPEKYEKKEIPKCYEYFFFRQKKRSDTLYVAIYHPTDKKLCFQLVYDKLKYFFRCNRCISKKKSYMTKLKEDDDGKEYFSHDYQEHVCKPIKVSSIRGPEFVILDRKGLNLGNEKKSKIDDSRIIKSPNFELLPNKKGIADHWIYYYPFDDGQNLRYKYNFIKCKNYYYCCNSKCRATARLKSDEKNGEKYLLLGNIDHSCEPVEEDEPEKKIINSSDFITITNENSDKILRVIVFTTPERDQCYEFGTTGANDTFRCLSCHRLQKWVYVKLCKNDENGQQFLQMLKTDHSCVPRKYIKEKFQPKTIPAELFELYPNKSGEPNKRLIIFTSDKKDAIYEFYRGAKNAFVCLGCCSKKHNMLIKLIEDDKNGRKYIEWGQQEHICKPRKFDPKKFVPSKIISSNYFVFHPNSNGEKDKHLFIFNSDKKDFGFQYYNNSSGYFLCNGCRRKNQNIGAKVIQSESGVKSIKLGEKEHICEPQKYDSKKYTNINGD